ncbi:hypothetical protein [Azotobacter chroococcum]|nr:hypothetical protein [Azotobacter chroococcum]
MQFKRTERHEAITYTSRKQAAFNRVAQGSQGLLHAAARAEGAM